MPKTSMRVLLAFIAFGASFPANAQTALVDKSSPAPKWTDEDQQSLDALKNRVKILRGKTESNGTESPAVAKEMKDSSKALRSYNSTQDSAAFAFLKNAMNNPTSSIGEKGSIIRFINLDRGSIGLLLDAIANVPDSSVRIMAIYRLVPVGAKNQKVADTLTALVASPEENEKVRHAAALGLTVIGDAHSVQVLQEYISGDKAHSTFWRNYLRQYCPALSERIQVPSSPR